MRVAIAGAGNVGTFIAEELTKNAHEVLLIEQSPEVAARLVASGRAEWLIPTSENAAATQRARRELAIHPDSDEPSAEATFSNG